MTRACSTLVAILALAAPAFAQDDELPPAPPEETPEQGAQAAPVAPELSPAPAELSAAEASAASESEASTAAEPGARTHDGFHLRLAIGFGGVSDTMTADFGPLTLDGKASGASISGHLAIAGEIAEGLFLGGVLMSEQVTNPTVEFAGSTIDSVEVGALGMLGLMIDWYPDARGGFHFGGVLGGASLSTEDTTGNVSNADERPAGGCGVLMVGYDFWIANEWSLGVMLRLTGAKLGGNVDHDVGAGSLLFSVLFN